MTSAGLALLLVASQPPGTDGGELRRAFERAYLPMLDALASRERVRVSMHWSGALLDWMELHAPAALETLLGLVRAGRIEPLAGLQGGGLLPALPERDVSAQVRASIDWWRERAGVTPRGAWLPHFGWDPAAARILGRAGIAYTVLEESQLGVPVPQEGYALTEREGVPLALFAADGSMAAMVPEEPPARILRTVDARARGGARLITLALPVEVFGAGLDVSATRSFGGPEGWVHAFLRALEDASHWLKLVPFGVALDRMRPSVRVYPRASVAGAVWRGMADAADAPMPWDPTLAAHPEINLLHKSMLRVSESVHRLGVLLREQGADADDPRVDALADAKRALWKAQDAAAYVLGPEVGAQDPGVRHAAWSALLRAEHGALTALEALGPARVEEADHDCDGRDEVLVRNRHLGALVDPGDGGALVALGAWTIPGNLLNVPTRRPLPGHAALRASTAPEDASLASAIHYDRHPRAAFVDHFLAADATLATFASGTVPDAGDFAGAAYEVLHRADPSAEPASVVLGLGRDGNVSDGNGLRLVRVLKRYAFARDDAAVQVRYELANRFHETVRSRFAVALDLGLDGLGPDVWLEAGGVRVDPRFAAEHGEHEAYALVDGARGWRLVLRSPQPVRAWHAPVRTVGRTPRGLDVCTQGVCLLVWWPVELYAAERVRFELTLTLEA